MSENGIRSTMQVHLLMIPSQEHAHGPGCWVVPGGGGKGCGAPVGRARLRGEKRNGAGNEKKQQRIQTNKSRERGTSSGPLGSESNGDRERRQTPQVHRLRTTPALLFTTGRGPWPPSVRVTPRVTRLNTPFPVLHVYEQSCAPASQGGGLRSLRAGTACALSCFHGTD